MGSAWSPAVEGTLRARTLSPEFTSSLLSSPRSSWGAWTTQTSLPGSSGGDSRGMIPGATTRAKFPPKVSDAEFLHVFHDLSPSSMQNNVSRFGRQALGSAVSKSAAEMLGVETRWVVSGAPLGLVSKGGDESLTLIIFLLPIFEFPHMTREYSGSSGE